MMGRANVGHNWNLMQNVGVCEAEQWQHIHLNKSRHECFDSIPDSKVHGANMGLIWGQQDLGGPHVCPMDLAIWDDTYSIRSVIPICIALW